VQSGIDFIDDNTSSWFEFLVRLNIATGDIESARAAANSSRLDSLLFYEWQAKCSWAEEDTIEARAIANSMLLLAKEAVAQNPDDGVIRSKLGLAHAFLGNSDAAVREGRRAVELAPFSVDQGDATEAAWRLFETYVFANRIDEALDQLEDLRSRPNEIDLGLVFCYPYYRPVMEHREFENIMEKYADTAQWRVYRELMPPP
jgi:tetratricopeptide (TPR) repeat protein